MSPVCPVVPFTPVIPVVPLEPICPAIPIGPLTPLLPVVPDIPSFELMKDPVDPVGPVGPIGPVCPGPVGPVGPEGIVIISATSVERTSTVPNDVGLNGDAFSTAIVTILVVNSSCSVGALNVVAIIVANSVKLVNVGSGFPTGSVFSGLLSSANVAII